MPGRSTARAKAPGAKRTPARRRLRRRIKRVLLALLALLVAHEVWLATKVWTLRSSAPRHTSMMQQRFGTSPEPGTIEHIWRPL